MRSMKFLLCLCLLFVLCTEGVTAAWASTRMAMTVAGQASLQADASAAAQDCDRSQDVGGKGMPSHQDCDCGGRAVCACSCALGVFPLSAGTAFAARHLLMSSYSGSPETCRMQTGIAPFFRPPIG